MKKAVEIKFHQVEGRPSECVEKVFKGEKVWSEVDAHIARCRSRMPNGMLGYFKCDFTVTYEDGETYTGRYDMVKNEYLSLAEHMRTHCRFYAGVAHPVHFTQKEYAAFVARQEPARIDEYKKFLNTYEIGGA